MMRALLLLGSLLVIGTVGLLSATPVPVPPDIQDTVPPPSGTQMAGDTTVTMTVTPGGPGVNTYDVLVTQDDQPVDNLDVRVQQLEAETASLEEAQP